MTRHLFWNPCKKCCKYCYCKAQLFRKSSCCIFWNKHTNHFKDLTLDSFISVLLLTSGKSQYRRNTQWAVIPQPWTIQAASFQSHEVKQPPHSCAVLYTWKTISKITMVLPENLDKQSLLNCHKVPILPTLSLPNRFETHSILVLHLFSGCRETRAYERQ